MSMLTMLVTEHAALLEAARTDPHPAMRQVYRERARRLRRLMAGPRRSRRREPRPLAN